MALVLSKKIAFHILKVKSSIFNHIGSSNIMFNKVFFKFSGQKTVNLLIQYSELLAKLKVTIKQNISIMLAYFMYIISTAFFNICILE